MLQLESYQGNMYIKWLIRAGRSELIVGALSAFVAIMLRLGWALFYYTMPYLSYYLQYIGDAAYVLMMLYIGFTGWKKPAKKPLVFTARAIRLLCALFVLASVFHMTLFLNLPVYRWVPAISQNIIRFLPGMLLPLFVLLAHYVTWPIETLINRWYFNDAKKKLGARQDLIKIGITGSYGKTSTKFILGEIVSQRYNTLVTPDSFNTPMGVTRVARETLSPEHRVFVAEMGARYRGDIKELCTLVSPRYGILTSVGKQHLDTFGDYETLTATKAELLQAIPGDGAVFINGDNPDCVQLYRDCEAKHKYLYGIEGENLCMKAVDIHVGKTGSSFSLLADTGEKADCHTVLLGKHNILNIAGAAALARYLGLTMDEIAAGVANIKPVQHRLQLIEGALTVIDDAYNANPAGTKAALEVLAAFAPEKRVIVTPGMIELGDEEDALNYQFGRDIAAAADIAILVGGRHVAPVKRGLLDAGFDENAVVQVKSLDEAGKKLPLYAEPGSVVLFENDLPDNYEES
jgi:UDP-N-acetylmuramoyl-tripeptide--D-alanyl-D-alanine ligase